MTRPGVASGPLTMVLLLAAIVLAYLPSFQGVFLYDDFDSIRDNVHIRSLWPPSEPLSLAKRYDSDTVSGRPVLSLSLALGHALHGPAAFGYHVGNLTIHLLAVGFFFGIVRRTLRMCDYAPAAAAALAGAAALLWGVHPITTGAVTYLVQRAESQAAMLMLASLYALVRACSSPNTGRWSIAAVAAAAAAMGSKETAVVLPVVALLWDRTYVGGTFRGALANRRNLYLGLVATWLVSAACAGLILADPNPHHDDFARNSLAYAITEPGVILWYLRLVLWPAPLVMAYDWPIATDSLKIVATMIPILALVGVALIGLWRRTSGGFLVATFLLLLAPTSSFVALQQRAMEHRAYLASACVVLAIVWSAHHLFAGGKDLRRTSSILFLCATVVTASAAGAVTWQRNMQYTDAQRFWQTNVDARPNSYTAHLHLGRELADRGRLESAEVHLLAAVTLAPGWATAHNSLGLVYTSLHQWQKARTQFLAALRSRPDYALVYNNLGYLEQQAGNLQEARTAYMSAVRLAPDLVLAHENLAQLEELRGDWAAAADSWRLAGEHGSVTASASAGRALARDGRMLEAEAALRRALEATPNSAGVCTDLGTVLAQQGRLAEARPLFERAIELEPRQPSYHYNLGNLLAAAADLDGARQRFQRALELNANYPAASRRLEELDRMEGTQRAADTAGSR